MELYRTSSGAIGKERVAGDHSCGFCRLTEEVSVLHVSSVEYLKNFTLRVKFDNGVTKDVDLANELRARVPIRYRRSG